jgi:hypothetical protein
MTWMFEYGATFFAAATIIETYISALALFLGASTKR